MSKHQNISCVRVTVRVVSVALKLQIEKLRENKKTVCFGGERLHERRSENRNVVLDLSPGENAFVARKLAT
jgi:hypothetical protein